MVSLAGCFLVGLNVSESSSADLSLTLLPSSLYLSFFLDFSLWARAINITPQREKGAH